MNEQEKTTRPEGSDDQPTPAQRVAEPAPNTIYRLDELEHEMEAVADQLDDLIKRYDPAGGLVGNKEMVRAWQRMYSLWNQAERLDHLLSPQRGSSLQSWKQYVALVEFGLRLYPHRSALQIHEKLESWKQYYANIRKLEAWRQNHGPGT